ncbi:MAG: hypothetical protein NC226_05860 [Bacteroides cellulosilyticus]|nr:hypothetical protein [Bacteroides cellulosilyticus]
MKNIWRKTMIKIGIYRHQPTEENHNESQQQSLMPTLIEETEPQYLPVKEIGEKLNTNKFVRNIALTGPYGSGKSSVLYTLQQKYTKYKYLQISLATLESYDIPEDAKKKKESTEQLNRLIEYSILQQLIYREKYATVPNSRIKRIFHFEERRLCQWTIGIIGFFIAYLIAFEPNWLRVEAMCRLFDWGTSINSVFDILSAIYMMVGLFICIRKILLSYYGYHLSKLNLKDGEIELKEASIFNKHLDEIIYFFQRTKYDVVIIEDLDRFNTSDIYLKLRELNQLINESKEIGRHIVFIYAVKDDVFKDAQRAKFFDYISTVIPVINPSNSMDELKHELQIRGYEDVSEDDLEEMAFFINDMRLLRNIANEYQQYRDRLCATRKIKLNPTKLLGMIVYKNCFPNDFALLHNRDGNVYNCIAAKSQFIKYAQQQLEEQKKQLESKITQHKQIAHLTKKDLREKCAYRIVASMVIVPRSIIIEDHSYELANVIENEDLFEKMIANNSFRYRYYNSSYRQWQPADFNIESAHLNLDSLYWNPKKTIEDLPKEIKRELKRINDEERRIKSLRLHEFFALYDMSQCKAFTEINLAPLQNVFVRRGYLDEDYYDYISYVYENTVTLNDRDLLLAMKQAIKSDYEVHIDKIENFAKKAPLYVFNTDAVLNNQLTDFLISQRGNKKFGEKFELLMKRIEREDAPLDFIAQYYQNGSQIQKFFEHFIKQNPIPHWTAIMASSVESERSILIEGWLRFCKAPDLFEEQQKWLNDNYVFLAKHIQAIGLGQAKSLSNGRKYSLLNTDSDDLLVFVIENSLYVPNQENLCIVVNHLNKANSVDAESLNLKRIRSTKNEPVIAYVEQNIASCVSRFSRTVNDEDEDALLFILNNEAIDQEEKRNYLQKQQHRIQDFDTIADEAKEMAVELFLLEPRWENVAAYFAFSKNEVTETLKHYIEHYKTELGHQTCQKSIAEGKSLYVAFVGSNILNFDAYKAISQSFNYTIGSGKYLADLESDRLDYLIDAQMITYTKENTASISSHRASTMAKYLIHHKNEFLKNAGCITYSSELALILFASNTFSLQDKAAIVPFLDADIISGSSKLATEICTLLSATEIELNKQCLMAAVATANDLEKSVIAVGSIIQKNPQDVGLIEELLQSLSAPYADIAVHDRKHPILEKKNYNRWLLTNLTEIGYLSSYSNTKKGLKVNKKAA